MRFTARWRAFSKVLCQSFDGRERISNLMRDACGQMSDRHQLLFTVHLILQQLARTQVSPVPEKRQEGRQQHGGQREKHNQRITPLTRLRHGQLTGIKGDKNELMSRTRHCAITTRHPAHPVSSREKQRLELTIDLQRRNALPLRIRRVKRTPARLFSWV